MEDVLDRQAQIYQQSPAGRTRMSELNLDGDDKNSHKSGEQRINTESSNSCNCSVVSCEEEEVDHLYLVPQRPGHDIPGAKIRRRLPERVLIKVGRLAGKSTCEGTRNEEDGNVWLTSKVVSRSHAEIWKKGGIVYVKDLGSSSGTFLNKIRLSPSGQISRPYLLRNGDTLQFGIDYKWKNGDLYQSVTFKVCIVRRNIDELRMAGYRQTKFSAALNSLMAMMNPNALPPNCDSIQTDTYEPVECCLCLGVLGPSQAIFLAPCSHCYHYRCVHQILLKGVMFQCPMCRQYANLTSNVSMDSLSLMTKSFAQQSECERQERSLSIPAHLLLEPLSSSIRAPALVSTPDNSDYIAEMSVLHGRVASEPGHTTSSNSSPLLPTPDIKTPHGSANTNINGSSCSSLRDTSMLKYLKVSRSISDKISGILKRRLCNIRTRDGSGHP